jgi:adenylate kinase
LACSECGSICNIYFSPPQTPGQCDKCKGKLAGRSDDKPEVVKERLKVYHSQTAPLIDYYKAKGRLFDIDGEVPADKVYSELKKTIAN